MVLSAEHSIPEREAEMDAHEVVATAVLVICSSEGIVIKILALAGYEWPEFIDRVRVEVEYAISGEAVTLADVIKPVVRVKGLLIVAVSTTY